MAILNNSRKKIAEEMPELIVERIPSIILDIKINLLLYEQPL